MHRIRNTHQKKRLLILGGQLRMCDVVRKAQEMGIYTIVTDWYENSPAKSIADKAYNISTSDVNAILQLIRDEQIDGVFTGFIDSTLPYYFEICRRAGLPCYLNRTTLECCTNKNRFKEVCKEVGLRTIPAVDVTGDLSGIEYPVLIKPADNSGSKGITVCNDEDMLRRAIDRARRFSKTKDIVAERFMDCDYVAAYYTVTNGQAELSLLMDKDMNRIGRGAIPYPTAYVSPSRYEKEYSSRIHPRVQQLIAHMGLTNGTFLISFFVNGRHFYAVEPAARLTATQEYLFTRDSSGLDTLEMHINYALNGKFAMTTPLREKSEEVPCSRPIYCMLLFFLNEGVIGRIEGTECIESLSGVLKTIRMRDIGAQIRADGSYGQLFFRVYLKAETVADLIDKAEEVTNRLQVYSEDGKPMVKAGFDAKRFFA